METKLNRFVKKILRKDRFRFDFKSDGFAVRNKNLGFIMDEDFNNAYKWSLEFEFDGQSSPWAAVNLDIRWRSHICIWAVKNALLLDGDLVECGVDSAVIAGTIAKYLNFSELQDRKYFLFDTYSGIPMHPKMSVSEQKNTEFLNENFYFDSYEFVKSKMSSFRNIEIIRGLLPDTLSAIKSGKISFLSVDLNNTPAEEAVISVLWDKLVPGAITVIDDYAFAGHEDQYKMWNNFARKNNRIVATLPTGQGVLIK